MIKCDDVLKFWNTYLDIANIPDASRNGLQVEGPQEVNKIVFGVSACQELFEAARAAQADLICVHHGLLWGQEQTITGLFGARIKYLLQNNMSLAAYHLPLDKHPAVGNNACLMRALNARDIRPFGQYHGVQIGYAGNLAPHPLASIVKTLEQFCGSKAHVLSFGPENVQTVGIISGGAYSMLPQALDQKLDLYVTGTLDEPAYEWCREGHINCVALGHYPSEKCGIQALMDLTAKQFQVQTEFIDTNNPL
ncbi:MAG: Nif3-like dinuclear metal center hexameric protein [Elusimicrobiaceae bacterium]|nr:Nif3-like dinuclear metal center hexameric protein [Elusimicrobiaceae bacterium]